MPPKRSSKGRGDQPAPSKRVNEETPLDPESDWEQLESLSPVSLRQVIRFLVRIVIDRLEGLVDHMNETLGRDAIQFDATNPLLFSEFEAAIFHSTPLPDRHDFYMRGAAAMRTWLLARLDQLAADKELNARKHIDAWKEYHRAAARLEPAHLAVHELLYGFGLKADEAQKTLKMSNKDFRDVVDEMMSIINVYLNKASKKRINK